jgi:uncharacterized DUF497 family protein
MSYDSPIEFEWSEFKSSMNLKKHGIEFGEAATIWMDGQSLEMPNTVHVVNEERWIRIGFSDQAKLLAVVYCETESPNFIRIISARKATRSETDTYAERL